MPSFYIPAIFTAIDKLTGPLKKMEESVNYFAARTERSFRKVSKTAGAIAKNSFLVGSAIAAPLVFAANEAMAFEDKLADVAKTTGLQGDLLKRFGGDILSMSSDTRTSIDDLLKISEIGGQLGIAQNELSAFTLTVDKFNVAMGADYSGGVEEAAASISKLKNLFYDTRNIPIAEFIMRTGSAINDLGAVGNATTANINDFALRLGALPDSLKPSSTNILAIGSYLEEMGVDAQIASNGLSNLLTTAGVNISDFSKKMGISKAEASKLLNTDPTEFVKRFAKSMSGLPADKLSSGLKGLKIGSLEVTKVIGALGSNVERLTYLQGVSNSSFQKATSLQDEFNKKNNTTKAQLEKAINNLKAFAIIIGTEVLPVVTSLLKKITPVIKAFIQWGKDNPNTIKTIVYFASAIAGLSFVISGISSAVALITGVVSGWGLVTKSVTAAQWLLNAALFAMPIGWVVVAIAALIAMIAISIKYWNQWGAAINLFLGPIGYLISIIQSFRRNWDMVVEAFTTDGILGALKAIGRVLIDALLMPVQQLFSLLSNLPGFGKFENISDKIFSFREGLGVNTTTDESGETLQTKAVNPKLSEQQALTQRLETVQKQNVSIDIADKTGRATMNNNNSIIPIKLTSTATF